MSDAISELRQFAAQLAQGPAFLILGQASHEGFGDPSALYHWSGVYTSRTDEDATTQFKASWRTSSAVGAMSSLPSRSQTDLQVRYLFGGHHLPDSEQPPADALQEADARMRCNREISRLTSETVTPRGVIVIEGWTPGDKLESRELIPALRELGAGQVHLFSSQAWNDDPFVSSLISGGQLFAHEESLDDAILQLIEIGAVSTGDPTLGAGGSQHVIALGDGFIEIDIHTWNQIRRTARPIDLELLTPPVLNSEAARYQEFRRFAGATEGSPRWRGISGNLNIRREFERTLAERVSDALKSPDFNGPIILSGQTATGKSVALAALALDLARNGDVAVLHQARRTVAPSLDDIDMYATWAEDHNAKATVLIWDGMTHPDEYAGIYRYLRNRGRKVIVVGSAYNNSTSKFSTVQAPSSLTEAELKRLLKLLESIDVPAPRLNAIVDSSFLAFLYHALPYSHAVLRSGLSREMRAAEKAMEKLVRKSQSDKNLEERLTDMAAALKAAGLELDSLLPGPGDSEETSREETFGERSAIRRVTTIILVSARHGVPVPIDLALRVLGHEGAQSIRDVLRSFDIIREIEDINGEYFLTTRSHLEAELLAQHEISVEVEIEVITEVIRNIRLRESFGTADEVPYLVAILKRISSDTPQSAKYRPFYDAILEALRNRRLETGHTNYRLVLQESKFTRNHVHWLQKTPNSSADDRLQLLEHNRDLLEETLNDDNLRGPMRLSLTVELAATLGSIMTEVSTNDSALRRASLVSQLDDILQTVLDARAVDPENLYPIDVLAWSTRNAVETNTLSVSERFDRLVSAVAMLDSVDRSPLTPKEQADLAKRSLQLNLLLDNDQGIRANLRDLEQNSDPAATYFLASREAREGIEGETEALKRLLNAPLDTQIDWRCAQLLLELTWKKVTGHLLFREERVPIHLSQRDAGILSGLTKRIMDADLPDKYKLYFVSAFTQFVLGDFPEAKHSFRQVEQSTRQLSSRLRTSIVLAGEDGAPQVFTGRVIWAERRSGEVWVNELGTKVAFEPHLFSPSQEYVKDQQLPAFMIGFKPTRGPVAEPRSMYRKLRRL